MSVSQQPVRVRTISKQHCRRVVRGAAAGPTHLQRLLRGVLQSANRHEQRDHEHGTLKHQREGTRLPEMVLGMHVSLKVASRGQRLERVACSSQEHTAEGVNSSVV